MHKKTLLRVFLKNGASNGLKLELYYVEFLHLCLHDEETTDELKKILHIFKS